MEYQEVIDKIFIKIAKDNNLKSGDFTPRQELALETAINNFLESCKAKRNNFEMKNETELEKYSYDLLKKIALENDYDNFNQHGKEQEEIIDLLNQYINQNNY